jgi:hypothetical protein
MELLQIVTAWDIRKYSSKKTIPTYEMIEAVSFIGPGSEFLACLGIELANKKEKDTAYFLTVGERGVVRIWCLERYISLHLHPLLFFACFCSTCNQWLFWSSTVVFAYLSSKHLM